MEAPVELVVRGDVGRNAKTYAKTKIGRVARLAPGPVLYARVKLVVEADPARERPAIAQALVDVDGTPVRAHTAARELREAVDLLEEHLRDQFQHLSERRQALRKRGPAAREPHEWRHGDTPTHRPPYFDRPPEERRVVRRKTFALHALSPTEATDEMDRLDYDFHLFMCADTETACVVARRPDGRVSIASTGPLPPAQDWLVPEPAPTPTLEEAGAIEHLNLTHATHVFYRDPTTGQGTVIYRRYDGHYGLITPQTTPLQADTRPVAATP